VQPIIGSGVLQRYFDFLSSQELTFFTLIYVHVVHCHYGVTGKTEICTMSAISEDENVSNVSPQKPANINSNVVHITYLFLDMANEY
jgi:hypothetical protein